MSADPTPRVRGIQVVLTREGGRNALLQAWVPNGAAVSDVPLTTTVWSTPTEVTDQLAALASPERYATLVVTSARVDKYLELVRPVLGDPVVTGAVGSASAAVLASHGFTVNLRSNEGAAALAPSIDRGPVLLLGALEMLSELPTALRNRGLRVDLVHCYVTVAKSLTASERATLSAADVLFIGAPSAWAVVAPFVNPATLVVVPGRLTAEAVQASHQRVHVGWDDAVREVLRSVTPRAD